VSAPITKEYDMKSATNKATKANTPAPQDRILRLPEVCAKVGISRSVLYRQCAENIFPQSVKLTEKSVGWKESDVNAHIANLSTVWEEA